MKGSKFLDHVREIIRTNHFSYSTKKNMSVGFIGLLLSIIKDIQMRWV